MFDDFFEQLQIVRQALAPLRLSRWQMTKMLAAQANRDHPILAKLAVLLFILFVYWAIQVLSRPKELSLGLPVLGGSKALKSDFLKIITEGKEKYPDTPYLINASGNQFVVYPPSFFDEIKRLPESEAAAQDFFYKQIYGGWTHIGTETDALWKAIGVDLARSVPMSTPAKQQDARIAFEQFVGYTPDWKPITTWDALLKIVATTNACSFVGRELAVGAWTEAIKNLPMTVFVAVMALNWVPGLIRPILAPILLIPALRLQWKIRSIIRPVLEEDMKEFALADKKKENMRIARENGRKLPFTAWLMSRYKSSEATQYQLATDYLITSFESTVSSAATLSNIIAELAVRPKLQDELREELDEVLVDGKLPPTTLKELKKMDSVMRETFRMSPFSIFTLHRVARRPIKLSAGPTIPKGTIICVDQHHINNSPTLWSSPSKYDPKRFLNKRQEPGAENAHQFVSSSAEDPNWGGGLQACPGRFFANNTIKVLLAHILTNYDVKLRDGEVRSPPTSMPGGTWAPDMNEQVLFKSRD